MEEREIMSLLNTTRALAVVTAGLGALKPVTADAAVTAAQVKAVQPEITTVKKGSAELPGTIRNNGWDAVKITWDASKFSGLAANQVGTVQVSYDMKTWTNLQTVTLNGDYVVGGKTLKGVAYVSLREAQDPAFQGNPKHKFFRLSVTNAQ
jgi:hypothetical protein